MPNWKLIKNLALAFGIVSVVFTVSAAVTNYELNKLLYQSEAPASLFEYNITIAISPFLLVAVLSFLVAALSSRAAKSASESQIPICPTCGRKLRFIPEYQRWYCDKEKKYV